MTSPPHYRRNFVFLLGDYVGFALGMTFIGRTTVLPAFAGHLTHSKVVIGLVNTVSDGAWLLPQVVFANRLSVRRRKRPYILLGGLIGRPFYLLYALALLLGLHRRPALALAALLGVQILFYGTDAMAAVAWFDVVGKAISERQRGRLFGIAQLISGLLAIGAGALISALLSSPSLPFPRNYALIMALGGVCFLLSLLSCSLLVEPDEPVHEERTAWRDYLAQLAHTLRHDSTFRRLILVRLLAGFDGLAVGFYILFATRQLGLPSTTIGLFTVAQIAGRILSSVGLGALAERAGSHRVIQVSTGVALSAPLVALALGTFHAHPGPLVTLAMGWVFVVIGLVIGAAMLGFYNYLLELAPLGQRPTYVGLFNTITGVLIVLPAVGGWLLQVTTYPVLFALTALVLLVAHRLSFGLPPTHLLGESPG